MSESGNALSGYTKLAMYDKEQNIAIVQDPKSKRIYLQKELHSFNMDVYESLYLHPVRGVPRIHALHKEDGVLTVVEEYISGDSLQSIVATCGPFTAKETATFAQQLCEILIELSDQRPSITHGNIKASNVLLTEDGRIMLLNTGVVTQDSETDLYRLGVLMETLLGGRTGHAMTRLIERCTGPKESRPFHSVKHLHTALRIHLKRA